MRDVIANFFVDVHPSKAKLTLFLDGNCFLIVSTDNEYSLQQRLLRVLAPAHCVMHYMTVVAQGLRLRSKACELKQILTWGSDSRYLGEIRKLGSSLLPVWTVVSVNNAYISKTKLSNMNFFCDLTIVIPQLPCLCKMAMLFRQRLYLSIQKLPTVSIHLTLQRPLLIASVSTWSWSNALMDGEELDDKQYIYW